MLAYDIRHLDHFAFVMELGYGRLGPVLSAQEACLLVLGSIGSGGT